MMKLALCSYNGLVTATLCISAESFTVPLGQVALLQQWNMACRLYRHLALRSSAWVSAQGEQH